MIISPTTDIGKKILEYLTENPATSRAFAERVGVTQPTISKLLKGNHKVSLEVHLKLEKFLKQQNELKQTE